MFLNECPMNRIEMMILQQVQFTEMDLNKELSFSKFSNIRKSTIIFTLSILIQKRFKKKWF